MDKLDYSKLIQAFTNGSAMTGLGLYIALKNQKWDTQTLIVFLIVVILSGYQNVCNLLRNPTKKADSDAQTAAADPVINAVIKEVL